MLHAWLLRPRVAEWWGPAESVDELRAGYLLGADRPNATRAFIANLASKPVGFIQCYVVKGSGDGWWEDETDPGARGIDQFLAEASQLGQGLGSSMIHAFVSELLDDPAVSVVQTDPNPLNTRAIRCYKRVGFREVGLTNTPDGQALLMRCTRQSLGRDAEPSSS